MNVDLCFWVKEIVDNNVKFVMKGETWLINRYYFVIIYASSYVISCSGKIPSNKHTS